VRVFVAGATGAIGAPLLRTLIAEGHDVTGMTRSPAKAQALRTAGAKPAVADALDADAVMGAVTDARPDAVVHELTSIPPSLDPRKIVRDFELTDRLRTEGTRNLVAAAQAAGASRVVAQSIAFAYAPGPPGTVHDEADPPIADPPKQFRRSAAAIAELERSVLGADGLVLRYGYFYGPGTSISRTGSLGQEVAKRRLPIIGGGHGEWSFIHVDDAARATASALTNGASGAYNVVDSEPAPVREWIPALAEALGAKPPLRVPAWLARPLAGEYGLTTMMQAQGASNARAKAELGWTPRHASWREGFRDALG
jgi:nucleoside-diphosphate-sugar epimerase